jgi:hypothetical protein
MSEEFSPSPDFVAKVMQRIHSYEAKRNDIADRLAWSRQVRYLLAGGGTVFGVLTAMPVF